MKRRLSRVGGWLKLATSRRRAVLIFGLIALSVFSACSNGAPDPADAVERYIEAKATGDNDTISRLLCPEMEAVLEREQLTFAGISEVRVEGMACEREGESTTVRCQGEIVALYGAEETEFPLISYRVAEEDGEWKWCGEAP